MATYDNSVYKDVEYNLLCEIEIDYFIFWKRKSWSLINSTSNTFNKVDDVWVCKFSPYGSISIDIVENTPESTYDDKVIEYYSKFAENYTATKAEGATVELLWSMEF